MAQIHKRFNVDQVRVLLEGYCHGKLEREGLEEVLGIVRSRFVALVKEYRRHALDNRFNRIVLGSDRGQRGLMGGAHVSHHARIRPGDA